MSIVINHKDSLSVDFKDIKGALPLFPTKKKALEAGKEFGWTSALRLRSRFETVWAVGSKDFQNDYICGISVECFRFPLLRWDEKDGVKFCPVLKVRRSIGGAA